MTRISAVIPVKNAAKTIRRTLESLRAQSHRDFEVLIVDGGSTDGTIELVNSGIVPEATLIHAPGSSITAAVNIGISRAGGDAIMPWLCADDYLDSQFFATVAERWRGAHPDYVFGNWRAVANGAVIKSRVADATWQSKIRYYMPQVLSNAFVFRRELFERVGPLDESLKFANDYEFLLRITMQGACGVHNAGSWYYYQVGGLSQSRHMECAWEVAAAALKHGANPLPAYWHLGIRYLMVEASFGLNHVRTMLKSGPRLGS